MRWRTESTRPTSGWVRASRGTVGGGGPGIDRDIPRALTGGPSSRPIPVTSAPPGRPIPRVHRVTAPPTKTPTVRGSLCTKARPVSVALTLRTSATTASTSKPPPSLPAMEAPPLGEPRCECSGLVGSAFEAVMTSRGSHQGEAIEAFVAQWSDDMRRRPSRAIWRGDAVGVRAQLQARLTVRPHRMTRRHLSQRNRPRSSGSHDPVPCRACCATWPEFDTREVNS